MLGHLLTLFKLHVLRQKMWLVVEVDDDSTHCYPLMDQVTHTADEDCICGPSAELVPREDGSSGWAYKHHSLDGREANER